MEKSVIFLLVVAFASALIGVDAACVERVTKDNNSTESTVDKLSNFFMEVGCSLKSGAEKVKERVESGYNYLKSKIDDSPTNNKTTKDTTPEPTKLTSENELDNKQKHPSKDELLNSDRITFKDDDIIDSSQDVTTAQTPTNGTAVNVTNRTAINAPEICPQGEVMIDGKCRQNVDV